MALVLQKVLVHILLTYYQSDNNNNYVYFQRKPNLTLKRICLQEYNCTTKTDFKSSKKAFYLRKN